MKIKPLFLGIVLMMSSKGYSQQSVNSSGGNVTNATGNISYSVGQVFSKSVSGASNSITEGVHQPFEISTLGVDNQPAINLEMKIYPNPTTSYFFLKIGDLSLKNLEYQLFEISGKMLSKNKIILQETQIDLSSKPSGIYILIVSDTSKKLKTFKIIKN